MAEPPFTMSKYGSELELLRDKCAWLEARLASAPVEDIPEAWLVTARYVSATGSTLKALCGDEESARSYIAGLNAGSFADVAMRPLYLGAAPKMDIPPSNMDVLVEHDRYEAMMRDVCRYRWLSMQACGVRVGGRGCASIGDEECYLDLSPADLDAACDAGMAGSEPKEREQ